ncbi:hypothetical protein GCM10011613_28800 [Cellvibrio zantedeschiae]|uniref:O-antigen polymerase n=1 Tax=Cellvibrio zantedeschiae TaxID=1237077 RepID=A0ABQ3B773_9GAMM|nr:O-antigen ligase family protein [Cellvibrio zantedeschiae]GGY82278.1 hypothetical protein GCM10011613_28800 [Cellvibrio zantedeschiae]
MATQIYTVDDFYAFKVKNMWSYCKTQHFSFWAICCYLFVEFVRPQTLIPALNILPWAMLFILLAAIGAMTDPSVKAVSNFANKLMVLFLLMIIISIGFAQYFDLARKEFMQIFNWFVIYFLIINIVNTRERAYIFILILLIASAKIAIGTSKSWAMRGFSFTAWGLSGPAGFFQNSGELAILMLVLFPLAFYMYQALKDKVTKWERGILILFWVCPILTILGASSRGAQLALAVQLVIMFRKSMFKLKPLIGVVILCGAIFYLLPQEQKDRFSNSGDDKTSQQRLLYWEHGWEMLKEYPLTGVGFFNFAPYYEDFYPQDMLYPRAQLPHNIFIQVGTDAGFIALFIFMLLIFYCFVLAIKLGKHNSVDGKFAAGLGFGVLGFAIAGQFVTVTYYPFLWINLGILVALNNITNQQKK